MATTTPSTAENEAAASNADDMKNIASSSDGPEIIAAITPLTSADRDRLVIPHNSTIPMYPTISNEDFLTAIIGLAEAIGSHLINFMCPEQAWTLQCRNFNRFLICEAPWSFHLLKPGDDINLFFVTHDNENRWAEVVMEALGIEVGSKDLKEVTKDATLDLTDDRVCHFRDGSRTRYWYLKHAREDNCRIVLHYIHISPEWLGKRDLARVLHENKAYLPDWPTKVLGKSWSNRSDRAPDKSWTKNVRQLHFQHSTYFDGTGEFIKVVYPIVRFWAEVHNLWTPGPVNATDLFYAVCSPTLFQRYHDECSDGLMLIVALQLFESGDFGYLVPASCRAALSAAATECLKDPEMTLATVRQAKASLAQPPQAIQDMTLALRPAPSAAPSATQQRFRDAGNAISRLRFDPSHADVVYDVGYDDRFEGMKWITLSKWGGKATEDESFIPEHRVRQIVRVKDGLVMWDREKREDRTGEV